MLSKNLLHLPLAAALLCPLSLVAQSMPGMPGMEHHHHDEGAPAVKLGEVHFPISCAASSQTAFELGIAMLHSFEYVDADQQFRTLVKTDPTCAMAHWGVAMAQFHEIWERPEPAALKTGAEQIAEARRVIAAGAKITPREQMYIDALGTFYTEAPGDYLRGANAYAAKMRALHQAYPEDIEGAAFYALSELASIAPGDTSLTHERAALAVLLPLFQEHPEHPGLAHYIIHTCDTPALAPQGLAAAKVYARLAPSSPHALHMPGHIFARLGMWQDDINSNLASVAASRRDEAAGEPGAAHQMHADEFLVYAYLQTGQDEKARALTAEMPKIGNEMASMPGMDDMKDMGPYVTNELNAITPMELHEWAKLETLRPAPNTAAWELFDIYWGQGVGAGHLRDAKTASAALAQFDAARAALKGTPNESMDVSLEIPRNEILAWKDYAEGKNDAALSAMRAAADQQDKLGQGEVDIPAREMLGDLLMEMHQPQQALAEYRIALKLSPNRLNGLLSAGAAAEAAGDPQLATVYYAQAAHNTNDAAESKRPDLLHAVAYTRRHAATTEAE